MDQVLIEAENLASFLCFNIDVLIGLAGLEPRGSSGKTSIFAGIPLHWGAGIITGFGLDDGEGLIFRLASRKEFLVGIDRLHIHIISHGFKIWVDHTDFFTHVNIRRSTREVDGSCQHGCALDAELLDIDKAVEGPGLVMVVPEEGRPAIANAHAFSPGMEEGFELLKVKGLEGPFLALFIVHLEVVEVEDHVQFLTFRVAILDAVGNIGKAHFPNGHPILVLTKGCLVEHFQIIVVDGPVCVGRFAITDRTIQ